MNNKTSFYLGSAAMLLGAGSLLVLAVSVWGFRLGEWPWPKAYQFATWGVWIAAAGVGATLIGFLNWMRLCQGGLLALLLGLVLSLPVAGLGLAFDVSARMTPPINDISTDTEDPPVFWFTVTPTDYPAANAEPQTSAYPQLKPLEIDISFEKAFELALALVEARGWDVLSTDPDESQIEAIATSKLFGFQDEVAIRVTETETGVRIDLRSRSRLGNIDRGANAKRISDFLTDLKEQT